MPISPCMCLCIFQSLVQVSVCARSRTQFIWSGPGRNVYISCAPVLTVVRRRRRIKTLIMFCWRAMVSFAWNGFDAVVDCERHASDLHPLERSIGIGHEGHCGHCICSSRCIATCLIMHLSIYIVDFCQICFYHCEIRVKINLVVRRRNLAAQQGYCILIWKRSAFSLFQWPFHGCLFQWGLGHLIGYGRYAQCPLTPNDPCCLAPEATGGARACYVCQAFEFYLARLTLLLVTLPKAFSSMCFFSAVCNI